MHELQLSVLYCETSLTARPESIIMLTLVTCVLILEGKITDFNFYSIVAMRLRLIRAIHVQSRISDNCIGVRGKIIDVLIYARATSNGRSMPDEDELPLMV